MAAAKKELELNQLKEEKLKGELQHLNNLLAASTMNLVVKNEFIDVDFGIPLKRKKKMRRNRRNSQRSRIQTSCACS